MKSLTQFIFEDLWYVAFKTPARRRPLTAAEFWTNNHGTKVKDKKKSSETNSEVKKDFFTPFDITSKTQCDEFWQQYLNWAAGLGGAAFSNHIEELGFMNLDELVSYVLDSIDKGSKDTNRAGFKELGEFFKKCYNVKRSKFKEAHDKFVNTFGGRGVEIDENYKGDDLTAEEFEHAAVCRSMWGETPIMLYVFGKKWTDDHNFIKQKYTYDTGCDYYHVRPILLKNWRKPEKAATRRATGWLDKSED